MLKKQKNIPENLNLTVEGHKIQEKNYLGLPRKKEK